MKNLLIYFFLFLLPGLNASGQILEATLIESLPFTARQINTDSFGNIYWINKEGVHKYIPETKRYKHYTNYRYGPVSFIDASDPLNVMVFYPQAGIVEILDNNLILIDSGINQLSWENSTPPSHLAFSAQQGIWALFPVNMALFRYDFNKNIQAANENILQNLPGFNKPVFMTEAKNKIFILTADKNIYVFDSFGNYLFTIKGIDAKEFQVEENHIVYFTSRELRIFNFVNKTETVFLLPEENVKSGLLKGQYLILQNEKTINRYLINNSLF